MIFFKLFERIESYYLDPSRVCNIIRKYQSLHKYKTTYLYAAYLSLSRFFHLTTAKTVPEFQNQASEKMALQLREAWNGK
jgi:hypothetical protein